ncbi:MAG: lipid-A-disaccharide synthase [Bacteroidia bacterium]|nr:lipid-A-disaccharide synthase [Bacteroidia bacterium]MDW8014481.1 lipid-A-disaccharide synthase [Bacteroidia bacterium]
MRRLRLYWVVGELSGEMHAAALLRALYQLYPSIESRGMGGEEMQALGMSLAAHWREYSVVGFVEVIGKLRRFIRLYTFLKKDILSFHPDRLILVDYPGLNLRLAHWAATQGLGVTYFIPPQLWAWNPGRVRFLRHPQIQILCILPFEPAFYAQYGIQAEFVGHPLVDRLRNVKPFQWSKPYIALLPGSRLSEVKHILPTMAVLPSFLPHMDFIVSKVRHIPSSIYQERAPKLPLIEGSTPELLCGAEAAVVASGTATLEAALVGTPTVIVYKGNPFSYSIAKRLVRVSFIGLPNLILGEAVFPELIQPEYTPAKVAEALLNQLSQRGSIQTKLQSLRQKLEGPSEGAVQKAAQALITAIKYTG